MQRHHVPLIDPQILDAARAIVTRSAAALRLVEPHNAPSLDSCRSYDYDAVIRLARECQPGQTVGSAPQENNVMAKKITALAPNIGISDNDRAAIAAGLSKLLADTYTLYLTTHNFHWNVTGPMFNTLHAMFMTQYTELWNAVDPVAERIRSLGHVAPGSYAQFGKLSSIADAPARPPKAMDMVRILVDGHEAVARTARNLFPLADRAGDEPTADLLTQRLTVHEQTAWMLRSLLEE
jgi:starvation-inducible DNA-binding protein